MHALRIDQTFDAEAAFADYIAQEDFPCLAAKTAVARGHVTFFHGSSIDCPAHDAALLDALAEFARPSDAESPFRSFVALFPDSPATSPRAFESAMWQRLQRLHDLDATRFPWDDSVSSDPASPNFSMSLGGHAFYVVGLHPRSTRRARRFPLTAMVFNLHRQFEREP